MSYQAKDFKVGKPINSEVAQHVQTLQEVFGEESSITGENSSREAYIQLQGATPWIKMQSGVRLSKEKADELYTGPGDVLAKAYVLFGMNYTSTKREGYFPDRSEYYERIKNIPGYFSRSDHNERPKAGITGMSISSHNRFGSLRTATISFQVWTKSDMDAYEVLYMRPGMTVLLEWGHSLILKDNQTVSPADVGIDYFKSSNKISEVTAEIQKKRRDEKYSYDGIVGIIKNFSWKFRPDGGYDCQVSLVTAGDLIESYKANFLLSQKEVQEEYNNQIAAYTGSIPATINFPSTEYDDNTPYQAFSQIDPLNNLYLDFVATVEKALELAPTILDDMLGTLAGDLDRQKDLISSNTGIDLTGINTPQEFEEVVEGIKTIFGEIEVAKGGQDIYEVPVYGLARHYTGTKYWWSYHEAGTQPIGPKSEWRGGIVDLNTGNNDLVSGSLEDGYVALTLRGSTGIAFLASLGTLSNTRTYSTTIGKVLKLLEVLRIQSGNNNVALFKTVTGTPALLPDPISGVTHEYASEYLNADQARRLAINAEADYFQLSFETKAGAWYFTEDLSNIFGAGNTQTATSQFDAYGNPVGNSARFFVGNHKYDDRPFDDKNPPKAITFASAHFTGYAAIKALGGIGSSLSATVDPNFQPTGEQVVVPNDTYLSKLHLYLRGRLFNSYANDHLKYSFIGKNFLEVFKYRDAHPDTAVTAPVPIEKLFGGTDLGAQTRLTNLKQYNSLSTGNSYTKQLKAWNLLLGGRFIPHNGDPGYNIVYVKLGALLELLNKHVLKSDSSYFFLFQSIYKDAEHTPLYRTMDDHVSSNPEICILPHQVSAMGIEGRNGKGYLVDKDAPIILNIELSIDFILQTLSKYVDDQGQVTVLTFLQEILDEITRVCGGINDLQLQYQEDFGLFHIVDRAQIAPYGLSEYPEFNVFGLNSIIRNINMVSKLTPKLSSMIAISAQDSAFTSTQDSTGFGALNRGVTDRLFGERYDEDKKEKEAVADNYDDLRKSLLEDLVGLKTYLADYYYAITIPAVGKANQPGIYQNFCNFLLGADSKYRRGGNPSYNFIIPFQVELELYGISGIQVMDAFVLSKEVLPHTYGGRKDSPVAFLVTGVEHKIGREGWTTLLKTQIFTVDKNRPSQIYPLVDHKLIADLGSYALPSVTITPYDDMTASQKSTIHYLYKTCIDYGLNDMQARAVLGVCSKECSFIPKMEDSYGTTSFTRLREIWSRFNQAPYATIDGTVLVKDHWPNEADFWDVIYQGHNGNDAPGDAFKYRGAGLNQITGKANYGKVQQWYVDAGSLAGTIDIVTDPSSLNQPAADGVYKVASHIAALWFRNHPKLNSTGTQDQITQNIFRINAGFGTSLTNPSTAQGLAKTKKFVASLPATIPAP